MQKNKVNQLKPAFTQLKTHLEMHNAYQEVRVDQLGFKTLSIIAVQSLMSTFKMTREVLVDVH